MALCECMLDKLVECKHNVIFFINKELYLQVCNNNNNATEIFFMFMFGISLYNLLFYVRYLAILINFFYCFVL